MSSKLPIRPEDCTAKTKKLSAGQKIPAKLTTGSFICTARDSLRTSASLRASLGDYLDDYGSGPEDAAAADGINL